MPYETEQERDNAVKRFHTQVISDSSLTSRARRAGEAMLSNGKLCYYGTNTEIATLAGMGYSTLVRAFRDLESKAYGMHHTNREHQSVWLWYALTKLDFNEVSVGISINTSTPAPAAVVSMERSIDSALREMISSDYGIGERVSVMRLATRYADAILRRGSGRDRVPELLANRFGDTSEYSDRELWTCIRQVDEALDKAVRFGYSSEQYYRVFKQYLAAEWHLRLNDLPFDDG